jgi:hypothetical protein
MESSQGKQYLTAIKLLHEIECASSVYSIALLCLTLITYFMTLFKLNI